MERLGDIIEKVKGYYPEADIPLLERAYVFSAKVHQGQLRRSGEPYLSHPLAVASVLADLKMDTATIAAGLLHDTLEDTPATEEELEELFGKDTLNLVRGVTNIGKVAFGSAAEKEAANYRKMILAMSDDIRVIIIKLADRLHNMRTLEFLPPPKRKRVARETLEIYSALAHRLGIAWIRWEMEDLAFRNLEPEIYNNIRSKVAKRRRERERYVDKLRKIVKTKLREMDIEADVVGRPKHFYSIKKKMEKQQISFEEVFDLIALRIVTKSVKDCYGVLGIIHSMWKPVPGRFKDYIAMPKENMYQSLHTTVVLPDGERTEFQIRTEEMNRIAEEGIAAHWKYKEGLKGKGYEEQFTWLRQILEWQQDLKDPREFLETFKMDLFPDEVYVFTPKGDVRSFPRGATPVDFAYAIHTEVGNHCVGSKVNGRLVSLRYNLKNGDRIEIMTSPSQNPSKDWLKYAVTSRARTKIRAWLKQEQRNRSISLGKDIMEKEFRRFGASMSRVFKSKEVPEILTSLGYKNLDELLVNVGYGKISPLVVAKKFLPPELIKAPEKKEGALGKIVKKISRKDDEGKIKVKGVDNILIKFSKCCNPIPGDRIVGFITRGRGISIHTVDCPNIDQLLLDPERQIEVEWDMTRGIVYPVRITVECRDRPGLLTGITACISEEGANITFAQVRTSEGDAYNDFEIEIKDLDQLNRIIQAIRKVKGVKEVHRVKTFYTVKGGKNKEKGLA